MKTQNLLAITITAFLVIGCGEQSTAIEKIKEVQNPAIKKIKEVATCGGAFIAAADSGDPEWVGGRFLGALLIAAAVKEGQENSMTEEQITSVAQESYKNLSTASTAKLTKVITECQQKFNPN